MNPLCTTWHALTKSVLKYQVINHLQYIVAEKFGRKFRPNKKQSRHLNLNLKHLLLTVALQNATEICYGQTHKGKTVSSLSFRAGVKLRYFRFKI